MRSFLLLLSLILVFGCKTKQVIYEAPAVDTEEEFLDTLYVTAPKPDNLKSTEDYKLSTYNPSYRLRNDLVHTKLDLKFNWEKEQVIGSAELTLKPYFYPVDKLRLDAKGFDISQIKLVGPGKNLKYEYDGSEIQIELGRFFQAMEKYTLQINYVATPSKSGGSAAILSDKGLFFINADKSSPDKPQQIWTQGETEHNSRWFPTIDKPNERCTQEMNLTVQDRFKTLSNGLLISSKKNADGTRTDYWKMDMPHAPYLFMIAVGEFAVVKDEWNGKLVDYYVEPEYEKYARDIFKNTTKMLDFFSKKLNYDYPWQKYSQVIVRDYVSGAMENTTGVIFGEFIQLTDRELIDNTVNEMIVAHELFHHWFGDLVTCESWANLTMNEGFADYSEYLWFEHEYGSDAADYHRLNQRQGYIDQTGRGSAHPLIYFGHADKEDMFDAHSYNKGGLVLHMLRDYVGDKAFWAALNLYLNENKFTAVEAHDLRLAFEEVTGEDLNWFFNQWYFSTGHPILDINTAYDETKKQVTLTIEQTQDPDKKYPPIFQLPVGIDIYLEAGKPIRKDIWLKERKQSFTFDVDKAPKLVVFDADKVLLYEKKEEKSVAEYIFQYQNTQKLFDRYEALSFLRDKKEAGVNEVFATALKDPHWSLRQMGVSLCDTDLTSNLQVISQLAIDDPHSEVRAEALSTLGKTGDQKYVKMTKQAIEKDRAYPVVSAGMVALTSLDQKLANEYAKKLETENDKNILMAVATVYGTNPQANKIDFFESNWKHMEGFQAISFFEEYSKVLQLADANTSQKSIGKLFNLASDLNISPWKRFSATKTLHELRQFYRSETSYDQQIQDISELITQIKAKETNDQLKMIYNNF